MRIGLPFAVISTTVAVAVLFSTPMQAGAESAVARKPIPGAVLAPQVTMTDGFDMSVEPTHSHDIDMTLDTDGDGLKDYFEQTISHSYKPDTDGDGITDANEDADADGLSNIVEQNLGTNPEMTDSDGDGLGDYEEVYTYKTEPTKKDTDGDNLSDGTEVLHYQLNPFQADQDGDGVLDGLVDRSFAIPTNDLGISGTMTGKGDIPFKLTVRQSPILLVQQMQSANTFDLMSLDATAAFQVTVPFADNGKNDLRLFRYEATNATLELVQKQHINPQSKTIEAEFTGGGSFVVMSMSEWKSTQRPDKAYYKGKHKPFNGKAKLVGLPGVEIEGAHVAADGTFEIVRTVKADYDGNTKTLKAKYQVQDMQISDGATYLTAAALTTESGLIPTIMVHGYNSNSQCWGYNDKWGNGNNPSAESYVYANETFTGTTYASGYTSTYSNIDTHFITSISDSTEMGVVLDYNKGFTPNVDLFTYEYDSTGHVGIGASGLKGFVNNLKSRGKIPSGTYINLLAHSKGGLVSRYYIENLNGSYDSVDRLVTLGTPHFGSDWSTFGDMDRDDSDLWLSNNNDAYCDTFTNSHPYTYYFAFGAFQASAGDLNATSPSQRGVWSVGQLSGSYDADVRNRFYNAGNEITWWDYADVEDGWVNIDSAMGSDKEPDYSGTLPTLSMWERWYVFHETYGGHSAQRKYSLEQNLVSDMLKGYRD